MSRSGGRHRDGVKPPEYRRRFWDCQARGMARWLDQRSQGWTVMYGAGSRRFYAMAAWPVPEPLIVEARTAAELEALMYEQEMAMVARREVITPSREGAQR
ncbi:hypothetical protein [Planotetraspora sp. GP83]|uniref:hypothetical protein n=1 Tax=Planotetraspora sp. GP83 TaxID=3156264 RepID=UPI003512A86C